MAATPGRRARVRRSGVVAAVLGAALALAACGSGEPGPAATATVDPGTSADKGAPPDPQVPVVWPLTGVPTDEVAQRPALAVKIENAPVSRPQTGLEQADMVWEEVVEGGITRFVAVYHSQTPEQVGPIRSVRPMDPAIVAPLHGLLAYSGAQRPFIDAVGAAGVQSVIMDAGDAGFHRSRDRRAPHNVYGTMADFWEQADGDRTVPPPAQLSYALRAGAGTATTTGRDAGTLDVSLSRASRVVWSWDGGSGTYLRSEGDTPAVSAAGTRLAAPNVVLLSVAMVDTPYKDPAGAPVPETQLVGTGTGVVASGGKALDVSWSKASDGEPLVLTTADGATVQLEQGATWLELVPQTGGGTWSVG